MMQKINIYKTVEELAQGFTALINTELTKKQIVNLSLSGGSTPKAIFDYWASEPNDIDWQRLQFFWGDERCVPPNDDMSNFGMTKSLLFDKIDSIGKNLIHRIIGEDDPQQELIRYTGILNTYLEREHNYPVFDIMMLGLGDDGHTVSIFPNQIDLWDDKSDCVLAKHPETGMQRVSLSGNVVNNSRNIAFLVTGKNKAEKVKQIVEQREKYVEKYPAARVNPLYGKLYWFLDEQAASLLKI